MDGNIHVEIAEPCGFTLLDTKSNRKILYILLRLLNFLNANTPKLSYIMISNLFGLQSRQDTNNFYRDFIESGSDFLNYLQRKIQLKAFFHLIEKQVLMYPMFSIQKQFELFKESNLSIKISYHSFRKYYNQINCSEFKTSIGKWMSGNQTEISREKIVTELFENYNQTNNKIIKSAIKEEFRTNYNREEKTKNNVQQVNLDSNFSKYTLSILISFFVACGLKFDVIKIIFGISKSTAWRYFQKMDFLKEEMVNSVKYWSGIISVDEKWVWVNKSWVYVLSAIDNETGFLLYYHISESLKSEDWELFFLRFKQLYGKPKLIVSDGSKSLSAGMKRVYKNVAHQL